LGDELAWGLTKASYMRNMGTGFGGARSYSISVRNYEVRARYIGGERIKPVALPVALSISRLSLFLVSS
jgi:hypothetical protein